MRGPRFLASDFVPELSARITDQKSHGYMIPRNIRDRIDARHRFVATAIG